MMAMRRLNRPIWHQYKLEASIFWLSMLVIGVYDLRRAAVCVYLPQAYAKWQLIAMNILQHDGCPTPQEDPLNHSPNFVGWLLNFLTFNNGFHGIHHETPGTHWSKLAELHEKRFVHKGMHPALNQKNIFGYIWRTTIWPCQRERWDGKPHVPPPCEPDEPWFDGQTIETYSG